MGSVQQPGRVARLAMVVAGTIVLTATACGGSTEQPAWVTEIETGGGVQIGTGTASPASSVTVGEQPDEVPPQVDPYGDDFNRIWREIQRYETWMLANPDPALASEHWVPGTEIHASLADLLTELVERGIIVEVGDYEVIDIQVVEADDRTAHLLYEDWRTYSSEVDAVTGEVLTRDDYDGRSWIWDLVLEADAEGRWRVASIDFVDYGEGSPL